MAALFSKKAKSSKVRKVGILTKTDKLAQIETYFNAIALDWPEAIASDGFRSLFTNTGAELEESRAGPLVSSLASDMPAAEEEGAVVVCSERTFDEDAPSATLWSRPVVGFGFVLGCCLFPCPTLDWIMAIFAWHKASALLVSFRANSISRISSRKLLTSFMPPDNPRLSTSSRSRVLSSDKSVIDALNFRI